MTDQISEEQALKEFTAAGGVTEEQALKEYNDANQKKYKRDFQRAIGQSDFSIYTGELADDFFSKTSVGRIMNAFGQGAQQDWGAQGLNIEGDLDKWVNQMGDPNSFKEKHKETIKTFNERFIRPWAHVADSVVNAGAEAMASVARGTGQIGTELVNSAKKNIEAAGPQVGGIPNVFDYAKGMLGEALQATEPHQDTYTNPYTGETIPQSGTWAMLPEFGTGFPTEASLARSKGIIGESEKGFFNTHPVTPKNLDERIGAAKEVGVEPPKVERPNTDPNFVARLIDPETFNEYDRLQKEKEKSIDIKKFNYWRQKQQEEFARQEDVILRKTGGDETALAPEDLQALNDVREQRKAAAQVPTPEEINLRQKALEADIAQRDLLPKMQDARERGESYLSDQSPEGAAFRDYIEVQLFQNTMKQAEAAEEITETRNHAQSLMPDPLNSPVYNNNPKYSFDIPVSNISEIERPREVGEPPSEAGPSGPTGPTAGPQEVSQGPRGPQKVSGIALDIEERAKDLGYTGEEFGGSKYDTIRLDEQTAKAQALIDQDYSLAKKIAYGREEAPTDLDPFMLAIAVERKATKEGDFETLRRLANSSYTSEGSRAAQVMRILQERDPYSPAALMSEIDSVRKKARDATAKK